MAVPVAKKDTVEQKLNALESEVDRLKTLYEQYFAGVNKQQPLKETDQLKDRMKVLGSTEIKSTAYKFRFQSIKARFHQLQTYWSKILKQIEEGTYHRDVFIARLHERVQKPIQKPAAEAPPTSKYAKAISILHDKLVSLNPNGQKIPSKEKFIRVVEAQIRAQKEKNPDKKIELKLEKDSKGLYQIKIKYKAS